MDGWMDGFYSWIWKDISQVTWNQNGTLACNHQMKHQLHDYRLSRDRAPDYHMAYYDELCMKFGIQPTIVAMSVHVAGTVNLFCWKGEWFSWIIHSESFLAEDELLLVTNWTPIICFRTIIFFTVCFWLLKVFNVRSSQHQVNKTLQIYISRCKYRRIW